MSLSQVTIACPHCRREYDISIDLAKLARITSRASCARCKKVFEVTPDRIQAKSPRSTDYRRETPLVARVASTELSRNRDSRRERRGYEERSRRTDDDRRDVRRSSEDRDVIRRAAADERRDESRPTDEATSPEPRRADSRTESRELRRAESRTESRELRRAESRTESREVRRTVPPITAEPAAAIPEVSIARTLSVRGARTIAEGTAPFRIPDIAPVPPRAEPSIDDPETAWLVLADPGLAALTVEPSEAASALEWLLSHAVGARREA